MLVLFKKFKNVIFPHEGYEDMREEGYSNYSKFRQAFSWLKDGRNP